jgi:hypothetical protein
LTFCCSWFILAKKITPAFSKAGHKPELLKEEVSPVPGTIGFGLPRLGSSSCKE